MEGTVEGDVEEVGKWNKTPVGDGCTLVMEADKGRVLIHWVTFPSSFPLNNVGNSGY